MIRMFRMLALFEGCTTLALFLIAMPAKYWFGFPGLVPPVGAIHGFAFLAYLAAAPFCLLGRGLSAWEWTRTILASFVPFGTFLNDRLLKRKELVAA
jgi:integral membrane protein